VAIKDFSDWAQELKNEEMKKELRKLKRQNYAS